MVHLKFGYIDKVGDADTKDAYGNPTTGMYRVRLIEEVDGDGNPLLTGWLWAGKRYAIKNQDDYTYDKDESVCCLLTPEYREGYIMGVTNNESNPPKQTDPDIEQKTFSDGSLVSYDRKNHKYTLYTKGNNNEIDITADGGKVVINGGNNKGMLILDHSVDRWNKLEQDVNNLKTVFTGWTPVPMDGGAALKGAISSWAGQQLTPTQASDVEDTKATH